MAAALLMSATRGILRSLARTSQSPAEVLKKLNCVLRDDFPSGRFVTMVYGVLDANRHTFTFANAGHPHPVFVYRSDATLINGESGLPLGLGDSVYNDHVVELKQGIKLLLYSDGISEATDALGEEFGTRRISEHMLEESSTAASLLKTVCGFADHRAPADDATVILLRCHRDERFC
jgi:sigma-B regulation protein RsbU (phosphoserine phosphatase)